MACDFTVYLNAQRNERSVEDAIRALDLLEPLEDRLSVYRAHSEISVANQQAFRQPVLVSQDTAHVIARGLEINAWTRGAFDMTSGPLSRIWGFQRRAGRLPTEEEIQTALTVVGSQWVDVDTDAQTVRYQREGLELNLGGIGKGFAIDASADYLCERGVLDFLIHGGHSSVRARGAAVGQAGWQVDVRQPLRPRQRLATLHLQDACLGTSGTATQSFYHQGKRYGHILDPRTGWPADQLLSVSVLAPDAATADALATAFYVLGIAETVEVCTQDLPHIRVLMIARGPRAGEVRVHTVRMSEVTWECTEPVVVEIA